MHRSVWFWVVIALISGALIGLRGEMAALAQATPGATATATTAPATATSTVAAPTATSTIAVPTATGTAPTATGTAPAATGTAPAATGTAPAATATSAGGAPGGGTGGPAAAVAQTPGRLVITVVERAISDTPIDLGAQGDSIGDMLAFGNPVYDENNQQQVGQSHGSCVRVVPGQLWECAWTTDLSDGSISVQGPFSDQGDTILTITGGTGAYAGASGEMGIHARDAGGTEYDFIFSIIRASLSPE